MKSFKFKKLLAMILVIALASSFVACSTNKVEPTSANQTNTTKPADAMAKYDPTITITTVRVVGDTTKFKEGESFDNNIWTRGYEDKLGIKVKTLWSVAQAQAEQKFNITIASNEIPDIMMVNAKQLKQLIDGDMISDLTDVYQNYVTPFTKDIMAADKGLGIKQSTFNGKLMALPQMAASVDGTALIWIRKDWLDKLGLQAPKTMQDVFKISEAFKNNDPDGNGKKDTFGLGLEKGLFGGFADLDGFFNSYHAYPNDWIKDSSGKLVAGTIQPEVKTALAKLSDLYKTEQIDKEFAVKDGTKVSEDLIAGKIGMEFGQHWNPFWPLQNVKDKDPKSDWKPYPIVSIDDKPARPSVTTGVVNFFVVKKGMKNPEAIVKLMNYELSKDCALSKDYEQKYHGMPDEQQYGIFSYPVVNSFHPNQNLMIYQNVDKYYKTKDQSILDSVFWYKDNVQQIDKYKAGDNKFWGSAMWAGPEGAFSVINKYEEQKLVNYPEFYGAPTVTMAAKNSTLDKMRLETFTKIIMGAGPIEEFDKYTENWKKLGGDNITKEVNDWVTTK